jgi:Leucine-rich repeat (LRR) protein
LGLIVGLLALTGCPQPTQKPRGTGEKPAAAKSPPTEVPVRTATAKAEDVEAAKKLLDGFGANAKYTLLPGGALTEIVVQDGSVLSADNIVLFGKLTDLEKLQIFNFRSLNDEMAAHLAGLKSLTTLALTNSVINDPTVELIAKSFPNLTDLDLSSNTNLTSSVLKVICELTKLQRLTLVQNRFNDVVTSRLSKLENLRTLDLRGNMEAGDMTLEVIAALPKLSALKHRSTAVSDFGLESLARSKTLDSLLMQDFAVTGQAGQHIAKLAKLTQLEIFRCQGFTSEGVLALKGMKLTRLTLRDLPAVDDSALEVFLDLPELKRLYLHEIASISDNGLKNLASLKSLEVLDIWTVPQMTDATVEVIATLPNLKELSIRTTGVTDAAVDKLLAMPNLQSLTFKDNGSVTTEGLKKLSSKKWAKLDIGADASGEPSSP